MCLSLVGNHSLDVLEEYAVSNFSQIVDKGIQKRNFAEESLLFDSETALSHSI